MAPLPPEQQAQVAALVAAQGAARQNVRENLVDLIQRILGSLTGRWYDQPAVTTAAAQIADLVREGQTMTAGVTDAYLEQVFDVMGITAPPGTGDRPLPKLLRDFDPVEEWTRPAKQYRRLRLLGKDEADAEAAALQRAREQAEMDLGLAMRQAARERIASVPALGFRRVLRPELSKGGTCGLCIVAADRVYGSRDLLPLHNGCNCDVLPIRRGDDPGQQLNSEDLERIYEAAGGTDRGGLQRVRIKVLEHGELGPVLVDAKHKNRDAADAKRDTGSSIDPQVVLDGAERLIADLERREAAGDDVAEPLAYQRSLAERMRARLAA